jgi:hypothetical protein
VPQPRASIRLHALTAALVAATAGASVTAQADAGKSAETVPPDEPERAPREPSGQRRALATAAAIVPGALLHGSGSWVLGDEETAERLLILEGVGFGAMAGSLVGAATTGAARSLIGVFIATGIGGLSLFTITFALDVYRVATPNRGLGAPRATPFFESHVGYVYVNDPVFSYHHFVHHGLRLQPGRFGLAFEGFHSPLAENSRLHVSPSARLWRPEPSGANTGDGSYLDLAFGATRHQFYADGFATNTFEVELASRVDSQHVVPGLYGSFAEFALGYAWRETRFTEFPVQSRDTLLLGGFGFGLYLGEADGAGGEVKLSYDHRHDGFAAGLKSPGLGSGVPGHLAFDARYYLGKNLGLTTMAKVGSAWVLGAGLTFRRARGPEVPLGE